ncbi:C25 family cysteine peptidase [Herpetosiphon sp. NSE202]|uniref:C25 family cysteine peptidase n=1 Tax=Herpetosiphon sp. NSE202 TaxID=3351349 RepID=UPI0036416838
MWRYLILVCLLGSCIFTQVPASEAQPSALQTQATLQEAPNGIMVEWQAAKELRPFAILVADDWQFQPTLQALSLDQQPINKLAEVLAPLNVLREGRFRGQRIVVLQPQTTINQQRISKAKLYVANAQLFDQPNRLIDQPFQLNQAVPSPQIGQGWRITANQAGMQQLTGVSLAQAGINLANLAPYSLQLWYKNQQLAIEERGTLDGSFDQNDAIWFYLPSIGDRWNTTSNLWLKIGTANSSPKIGSITLDPTGLPTSTQAYQTSLWYNPQIYDSLQAGTDDDHWFSADLKAGPELNPTTQQLWLTSTLPLATGPSTVTLNGIVYTSNPTSIAITSSQRINLGLNSGVFTKSAQLAPSHQLQIAIANTQQISGIALDRVLWQRPVVLNANAQTIQWQAVRKANYSIINRPNQAVSYNVSQPWQPQRMQFNNDLLAAEPGDYLLVNPANLPQPSIAASAHGNWQNPAKTIYLAPKQWHNLLQPLIERREQQGLQPLLVDVQAIYDRWSSGNVDPLAIRNFMRYLANTWPQAPQALVLVGDGTIDPRNYLGRNNPNQIPPLPVNSDPWLGEIACDTCFVQLDGDKPLADPLPDLQIGRLPAKTEAELTNLINKIDNYESAPADVRWRSRQIYVADNYKTASGQADYAGDFAALSDAMIGYQPNKLEIQRVYYDPWRKTSNGLPQTDPWRIASADQARQQTFDQLNQGAAVVTYVGHSHQYQWAITDLSNSQPYLLSLYDSDRLQNSPALPMILEMTCLTSAFQTIAWSGTSLDERLVLQPNGGAIATWGSAGLGVAYGHDLLNEGWWQRMWSNPRQTQIGTGVLAGLVHLFSNGGCCQDSLQSSILLGDPNILLQHQQRETSYLPAVIK